MNKTVLITGSSRGIGAKTAEIFAINGYNVVINYNNSVDSANELLNRLRSNGGNAIAVKADVSKYDEVKSMFDNIHSIYGGLDILVNNAGICESKLFIDMTPDSWNRMMDNNLNSVFYCTRLALPDMISNKSGKIINISSIWGVSGASMEVHYSAAKAGIIGITKALAKEYGPSNIQINCITPGVIDTAMNNNLSIEDKKGIINDIPLGRFGRAEEVAELIYFLASEKSDYITGQIIGIDGGYIG